MTKPAAYVVTSPDVLFREMAGEAVLLHLRTEHYYSLNEIGCRLWQLLSEHGHTETAIQQMLAEYEVDEATLVRDMWDLIAQLEGNELITVEQVQKR